MVMATQMPVNPQMKTGQVYNYNSQQTPMAAALSPLQSGRQGMVQPGTVTSTPAGLNGTVNNNRYGAAGQAQNQFQAQPGAGRYRGGGGAPGMSNANATQWNTNYGAIDTGVDAFQGFADTAYAQAMRQLQPQMDQQARALDNQLVARGLQPGSAAYNAEKERLSRSMTDARTAAAYGAQQAGLNAQNQYFNQEAQNQQLGMAQANQNYGQQFGYDQLANQRAIAQQQAAASSANAAANAQASMYGADLRHALGMNQLNENARQYDIGNITQTYGMDQNFLLGALGQLNNFNSNNINAFNAQNNANNMYFNQLGGMLNNAPGVNFVPNTGYLNSQIDANQYLGDARQQTFDNTVSFLGSAFGMSDSRLKKNIEHVGNVEGVNVYEFDYIDEKYGKGRRRGVMADEVIKSHPHAVRWIDGFMAVIYDLLPVDLEVVA